MTILATGADLATEVAAALNRNDLTARIPSYIVRAEAKLNRLLRGPDMETLNQAFSIATEYVAVPTGFLEAKSFHLNTNPRIALELAPDDALNSYCAAGQPVKYAHVATNFRFGPVPDATYTATLVYMAALTSLSGVTTTTNWAIVKYPDLYLYGTLLESAGDYRDQENLNTWAAGYKMAADHITLADNKRRWGGNNMQIRRA